MTNFLNLPNSIYTNRDYYNSEVTRLRDISFFYVCMINDIENHNDYKTLHLHGKNLIIFNDNGQIKTFENKCVHRFAKLFESEKGNSKLLCRYHGFTYDGDGNLKNKNLYSQLQCTSLVQFKTEVVGNFVFVTFNSNLNIKDFLGKYWDILLDISKKLYINLNHSEILHKSNWKLLVENVLESYHCPLVHTDTLVKDGYCVGQIIDDYQYYKFHSHWKLPKVSNSFDVKKFDKLKFILNDKRINNHFEHYYIFPNLVITSTEDYFFYVGNIHFNNVDSTVLKIDFYKQKPIDELNLTSKELALERAFFDGCVQAGLKVLFEDKPFVESCFNNLCFNNEAPTPSFIKEKEFRLIQFLENYQNSIYQYGN